MRKKTKTKARYRLRNWPEYDAALARRGSLTLWLDAAALAGWVEGGRTGRRGRPRVYSDTAICCMLTLRALYHQPLRATEGLVRSLVRDLLHQTLPVADHTTLSRRARALPVRLPLRPATTPRHLVVDGTGLKVYGEGEWKVRRHGWTKHRTWLKVSLGVDEATHELCVVGVSTADVSDGEMLPSMLAAYPEALRQVTGDGIYDEWRCYDAVAARPERPRAVFPPPRPRRGPKRARIRQHGNVKHRPPLDRDQHIRRIRQVGRRRWKQEVGYHRRSLAETAVFRLKTLFGDRVRGRRCDTQTTEVWIRCAALNRMTHLGMPRSVRVA